jgi:glycosyltransferase involved in cell wall biosynthesis
MRLLFIIPSLQGGGAEKVIVCLLRYLDRSKYDLALAVVDTNDAIFRSDVPEDVEFIDLHCSRVRFAMPKIAHMIWKQKPDVVFSTLGHLNLALAIIRPFLPNGVRYIARETIVVSLMSSAYNIPFWWNWAYRKFYNRFDTVVCQSQDMRDDLLKNFGLLEGKIVVINNPVDVVRIRLLAAEPLDTGIRRVNNTDIHTIQLVAIGRLSHQKGFDLLIEAIALCKDPRLRLTLLGDGPMRKELHRLTVERGVANQIRFAGFQINPYPFLVQADAFVLSSRFEGFPNVVLEALACGTPVIASPAPGGIREILERVKGCVIADSVTAEGLAKAIQHFPFGSTLNEDVAAPYAVELITRNYEQVLG